MYKFGNDGWFRTDMAIVLCGLDQQGLLEQKYNPVRLNGRLRHRLAADAICRKVSANRDLRNPKPEIIDIVDDEPDLVAEHAAAKARARAHHSIGQYYKVRRRTFGHSVRPFKDVARRNTRRELNNATRIEWEADVIGAHGCEYAEFDGKVVIRYPHEK